jgi:hypothetical protein
MGREFGTGLLVLPWANILNKVKYNVAGQQIAA